MLDLGVLRGPQTRGFLNMVLSHPVGIQHDLDIDEAHQSNVFLWLNLVIR